MHTRPARVSQNPTVAFHVAVGEGEVCRSVVVGSREISPAILLPAIHEEAVVEGVGVLIQEDINVGRVAQVGLTEGLDEQGIEGKAITADEAQSAAIGHVTVFTRAGLTEPKRAKESGASREHKSVRSYRAALQKLDRAIRQTEERLESRQIRLRSLRWDLPKPGRGRSDSGNSQSRLQQEIEDLQRKLEPLRQERSEVYEDGKRAGFLPGELSGKGVIP